MEISIRQRVLIYWCILTTFVTAGTCGTLIDRRIQPIDCETETKIVSLALDRYEWQLWKGFLEITRHCLAYGELLDCVEFEEASRLSPKNCKMVLNLADIACTAISNPIGMEVGE